MNLTSQREYMKIKIIKDSTVTEAEITVKCAAVDENLKRLLDELEHNNAKLTGRIDDKTFLISAEMIYYIESVDEKTFIYSQNKVYETDYKLYQTEQLLPQSDFVRISKNCILNISKLTSVKPLLNGKMEVHMNNGEVQIVNRHYLKDFKSKLKWFFTKRKMLTIILLILYVMISLLLNNFFIDINANENAKQTNIEVFQIAFEITSYLFVNAGVIIAVWQYYLSSKSEIIRNETDKVNKAIELSGFYKDNILSLFQPVRYVFDKIGAINIVKEIDKTQMQNFNTDELQKLLPAEKINIMKNMFTKAEFVESVLEANYIYGLDFGAVRNPKICLLYTSPSPRDRG